MEDKLQNFRRIILNNDSLASELKKLNSIEEIYNLYKKVVKEECLSKDEFYKCVIEMFSENVDEKNLKFVAGGSRVYRKTIASLLAATSVFGVSPVEASASRYKEKNNEENISFGEKVKNFISNNPFRTGTGILGLGATVTLGTILFLKWNENNSKQQNNPQSTLQDDVENNNPVTESLDYKIISPNPTKIKNQKHKTLKQNNKKSFNQKYYSQYSKFFGLENGFSSNDTTKIMQKIHFTKGNLIDIKADAIVNAANADLKDGSGVSGAIFKFLGSEALTKITSDWKEKNNNNNGLNVGQAAYTSIESIKNDEKFFYKGVIHTVGPNLSGVNINLDDLEKNGYLEQLKNCYKESIKLCFDNGLKSVAFPSISTGIFKFPASAAMFCAMQGILEGIEKRNTNNIPDIYFVRYQGKNSKAGESEIEAYNEMVEALGLKYEDFPKYDGKKDI